MNKIIALVFTDRAVITNPDGSPWFEIPAATCASYRDTCNHVLAEIAMKAPPAVFARVDLDGPFSQAWADAIKLGIEHDSRIPPNLLDLPINRPSS